MQPIISYGTAFVPEYNIDPGPWHVAFSGGRSSAMMLKLLLEHHGGKLPDNYYVLFTNTGREHPKTLEFVQRCAEEWGVKIIWLEFRGPIHSVDGWERVGWEEVDYKSASRNGQPFKLLNAQKNYFLARRGIRICTLYLKTFVTRTYLQDQNLPYNMQIMYGYRADEGGRLERAMFRCGRDPRASRPFAPLLNVGINKDAVRAYWRESPFDLGLSDHLGNCVHCFLKGPSKIMRTIQDGQDLPAGVNVDAWIEDERMSKVVAIQKGIKDGHGSRYLPAGYRLLKHTALSDTKTPLPDEEIDGSDLECGCTD